MHKAYIIQEDDRIRRVLDSTYNEMLAAVRERNPKAESLIEDRELSQLHDLLALLRLGHIRVSNAENEKGLLTILEVREG
jgi:hypothetical protein